MPLSEGIRLGRYEIRAKIGEGGMGEVYLAQDTRLRRKVALKVLPRELITNHERLHRFELEAQAASALNHPNIITIHEIGSECDTHFITTEFIDGQTLRQKLQTARLEIEETLKIVTQIATALDAAHRSGIIHRDIKPENIMVREDGLVKVLDFGLAKLAEEPAVGGGSKERSDPEAATRFLIKTMPGLVMGTVTYMSPEQARGKEVDPRTDIFSLGIVLYEMLVGESPFARETTSDVLAAILTAEPAPPSSLDRKIPAEFDRIVSRALAKEREARYQAAKDLLLDLSQLQHRLQFEVEAAREFGVTRPLPSSEQATQSAGSTPRVALRSLAVLPFANVSGEPQMEYLSDGLSENILFGLSQLPEIQVVARSAAFRHKGSGEDPLSIGRTLGVGVIVTGRVRQRGPTLLISAELIDVESGWQLWGAQYKRGTEDLVDIEDEIANEISKKLRLKLSPETQRVLDRRRTNNTEAYHLYLKGRFYWAKRTEDSLYKSIRLFRQAIEADPMYALAYAGLAEGYVPLAMYCHLPPRESVPKAKAAAEKALEIEPELPEALSVLGSMMAIYDWNLSGAEGMLGKALQVDPKYPRARQGLAEVWTLAGRFDEAIAEVQTALDLDPLALHMNAAVVMDKYFARRHAEAIKHGQQTIDLDPSFFPTRFYLGLAYQANGQFAEAIAELQQARALSGNSTFMTATLAGALASSGKVEEANAILAELDEVSQGRYVTQTAVAAAHACKGDLNEASARLERACDDRCPWLLYALKADCRFDVLRDDARFQRLVQRVATGAL